MPKPNKTLAKWANASSKLGSFMVLWSIFRQYTPFDFRQFISHFAHQLFDLLSPHIHLHIDEFSDHNFVKNEVFASIQAYLSENGSKNAKNLRLLSQLSKGRILGMDPNEEMADNFKGVSVRWTYAIHRTSAKSSSSSSSYSYDRKSYCLIFHKSNRNLIEGEYLDYVINEGKKIIEKYRTRKLFTNKLGIPKNPNHLWDSVEFKHPATFDKLAINPEKKREIITDLLKFRDSEEFYSRIGKPWKRGYLLYGPPGTGKSTMIAAMANLLEYDVYDLELTAVKDNTQLRRLLINTTSRSVISIEDIDCSLDLTGNREKTKPISVILTQNNSVTLSGLLNTIDGIWSSIGGERIIVFTTNSVEKLDPALIRTGRMDKHIELSYCDFESFKVLAKLYLLIDEDPKFDVIRDLLEVTNMTPADVSENLLPKCPDDDAGVCLDNLICALEKAKEEQDGKRKAMEEAQNVVDEDGDDYADSCQQSK